MTPAALLVLACCVAQTPQVQAKIDGRRGVGVATAEVRALVEAFEKHEIGRVVIVAVPLTAVTRIPMDAKKLEEVYEVRLELIVPVLSPREQEWLTVLRSVTVDDLDDRPDLRVGVLFFSRGGRRVGSIFFEALGRRGTAGGSPVIFGGDLFAWLRGKCFACLK